MERINQNGVDVEREGGAPEGPGARGVPVVLQPPEAEDGPALDPVGDRQLVRRLRAVVVPVLLLVILAVSAGLRFTNLNWDEGQWIHPDEGHMRMITSAIKLPDRLSLYFDTHNSPLNCRNSGQQYSYGTLPLFLTRAAGELLGRGCESPTWEPVVTGLFLGDAGAECNGSSFTGFYSALVGRSLSALADLGTVFLVYLIGRRLHGEAVGLLAAALYGLAAFAFQQAHFYTVDSPGAFFTTLTAYLAILAAGVGQAGVGTTLPTGAWVSFGLAGLATGLAAACKVSAVPATALLVVLAAVARWLVVRRGAGGRPGPSIAGQLVACLVLAGLLSVVAFRCAQPYAFEGPGFFGLRPSPEWFGRLGQIADEQGGEVDYPSGRQWTGRAPLLFPWVNMVVWGMGIPLGLAAWAGWAAAGLELRRGKLVHLVLWAWVTIMFVYLGTRWVKTMRYFLALYPALAIMGATLLVKLSRLGERTWRWVGIGLTVLVVVGTATWAGAVFSIYMRPHTRLASSRWIIANVPRGSTIANEHWDWGLPLRVDGYNPFGELYGGLEMQHYDDDTYDKRAMLLGWIDRSDVIITASNRLYGSISRLPDRYPLTTEYYRALFAGELGFELAATFTSYPQLGPFIFPDQENPYPLVEAEYVRQAGIEVRLPAAEEAFSVYDHPDVFIFRKTEDYSRESVEAILGQVDLDRVVHGLKPVAATAAPDLLAFDPPTWAAQQAGGTWSRMFNRDGLFNRLPGLGAFAWWVVTTLMGWLAFPLLFVALPRLRDRGYGMARLVGLLLVAYLTWLAASLRLLPNTRGTILGMFVLLAVAGGAVGWWRRRQLVDFVVGHWKLLASMEGLFVALYLGWLFVRLLQPDLWHPIVGGEKPMDFAYFNAVMKSTWFPPYNPWYSGSYINYYYFGFVLVGVLTQLVGTVPAIAYNLAVPLLFGLTGVGAFSVAYNLFGDHRRGRLLAGAAAVAFTVLLGNLGVVHLLRNLLMDVGGRDAFASSIPLLSDGVAFFKGVWKVVAQGARLSLRPETWYWHPSRIIPSGPNEVGPISEFPAFTFLYGDLHAHMMAFPLTLASITLAVHWVRSRRAGWISLVLGGLVVGALWPTNSWDYPIYLLLGLGALAVGTWADRGATPGERVWAFLWRGLALVGLTVVFYGPYLANNATAYTSFDRWEGSHTPLGIYLWIHGIMLFPLLTRIFAEVCRAEVRTWRSWSATKWGVVVVSGLGMALLVVAFAALGYQVAVVTVPVLLCVVLLFFVPGMQADRRLLWLMVGGAMVIGLAVEIIVLKGDIGRMNTVFKFYLQAWVVMAVGAGVSLAWVREHARHWPPGLRHLWWIVMAVLVVGGALFLPFGVRARAGDRISEETPRTLDGMAFMAYSRISEGTPEWGNQDISLAGDYYAMRWMQNTVQGSPVILEGLGYREYLWGNRVSIYTGLPAVIGWRWHQVQQRAVLPAQMVDWRVNDVRECYNTVDTARAVEILARYGVRYIYVGDYERAYYIVPGLAKFDDMVTAGILAVVYDEYGVKIYEVVADLAPVELESSHIPDAGGVYVHGVEE